MGQVIQLPGTKRPSKVAFTAERRHALVTGLCALTFLLGFFIIGPSLAIFAFSYVSTSHFASAVACVIGLAATWALTRVAYKHL